MAVALVSGGGNSARCVEQCWWAAPAIPFRVHGQHDVALTFVGLLLEVPKPKLGVSYPRQLRFAGQAVVWFKVVLSSLLCNTAEGAASNPCTSG